MRRSNLEEEEVQLPHDILHADKVLAMDDDSIMNAPQKPLGVSPQRWRIEKRRRRNAAYYDTCTY